MATQVKPTFSLSITDDSQTMGFSAATSPLVYDLAEPSLMASDNQAMTANYASLTLGGVGWTNGTILGVKNHSTTDAEVITIARHSEVVAGLTKDADTDGGALPATLTAGHYTEINVAGTSQGKNWEVGDYAIYLGASGTYAQIRPAKIATLKKQEGFTLRIPGDGAAWKVKAASGTPLLGWAVAGPLA